MAFWIKGHRWFCFFNLFEFWLCWVFITAYGLSLVEVSLGYSVAVPGLLIAVVSHCERGLLGMQAESLWCMGLVATACGVFPDQGSNLCPLHWHVGS